ncbi:hypothetical protein LCGC14_1623300 [marine sediment metagenome]|uniref:Uncharacterized protein n=1 Tax=marine sediment metagenome TaxID=412755 RepID=A0A0F9KKF5_9ZZZZ
MAYPLNIEDVKALADDITDLFPDTDADIKCDVIRGGDDPDYNYDRGEIRRGRFVLHIADIIMGDDRKRIPEALEALNFREEIALHETLTLATPESVPPGMASGNRWQHLCLYWKD